MWVPIGTVLQLSIFSYSHIRETFLLFYFEGTTTKRLLISFRVRKSLTLIHHQSQTNDDREIIRCQHHFTNAQKMEHARGTKTIRKKQGATKDPCTHEFLDSIKLQKKVSKPTSFVRTYVIQ